MDFDANSYLPKVLESIVELVDFDLDFLELLKKLLQLHLAELDALRPIDVLRRKLLELPLLDVFVVFASLVIRLQVKGELADGSAHVAGKH